ncbi:chromatin assembly factor 1 subunit A [Sabethes cyaneus]|uniref:chromatin assembly factor 1 subunit A n=1 Tax=Sabethes cyaneus TaxID=53552 RepID=UPI00237DEB65|nr:chromatin assembly factor 1 subunit A [Sabethes cyaneus]
MMESVVISDSKLSPSADGKKLKQSRLPFQVLSGSPATPPAPITGGESRKRKSTVDPTAVDGGGARATKICRISEVKENVKEATGAGIELSGVVVLDDGSNSADMVDVRREDKKLVAVKVESSSSVKRNGAIEEDEEEEEESSESVKKNDKIMIKFPVGNKKKEKKDDKIQKEAGSGKKKVHKEKKKQKKDTKRNANKQGNSTDKKEVLLVEDSDLSDGEKNVGQEHKEQNEGSVDEKIEPPEDSVKDNEVEAKSETQKEEPVTREEEKVAEAETAKATPDVVIIDEKVLTDEKTDINEPEVTEKENVESEAPTPRRGRSSRVIKTSPVAPKTAESTEKETEKNVKPVEEASQKSKSSKKLASGKKNAPKKEESPKAQTDEPEKRQTRGALDKFFAKVDGTKSTPIECEPVDKLNETPSQPESVEETEQKTPEKAAPVADNGAVEMDIDQQPADTKMTGNNSSIMSICLDELSDGNTADDEENAYMLCTPNTKERTLLSAEEQKKKLTPKQLARRVEAERRQALKQQELEEKKRKRQEEKDARQREREEQERLKKKEREDKEEQKRKEREEKEELKRKEREEKEEQKRKEREEKEKKRQAELDAKNEEKRKKDEQKEEERRKKEEEKEAEEKRKQKTAQAFQSFFVKKANGREGKQHSEDENSMDQQQFGVDAEVTPKQQTFMPFCVKGDMRLAPLCRALLEGDRKNLLDEILRKSSDENGNDAEVVKDRKRLYLAQLKVPGYTIGKSDRTWVAQDEEQEEDDVIVIDDTVCHQIEVDPAAAPAKRYRAKYFLFEENRRPPYLGTWRKKSAKISARHPFAQDTKFFDYEVDSDDEWEEEEPGESLHGSDDEKDVDTEEDYEVDNDFFVPHGHLSDEEMQAEDDALEDNSPETQKAKLKILQLEFAAEMKKKTEKIKPRLIGCIWENAGTGSDGDRPECSAVIWDILKARAMLFDPEEPVSFTVQKTDPESNQSSPNKEKESVELRLKKTKLVDEGVKELIQLVHGCAHNKQFLVKEFLAYWAKRRDEGELGVPLFAPESIRTKMVEISSWRPCPDEGPMQNKMCWYVHKDVLKKYQLTDITVPTDWNFILKPIAKSKKDKKERKETDEVKGGEKEEKTPPKKESSEEKEKKERLHPTPTSSAAKPKTPAASITKFTKKLSDDDKRKQFGKIRKSGSSAAAAAAAAASSSSSPTSKTPVGAVATGSNRSKKTSKAATSSPGGAAVVKQVAQQPKKRVQLLMSVPKGQTINESLKNNLISQFLAKGGSSKSKPSEPMEVDPPTGNGEEVIVLDD